MTTYRVTRVSTGEVKEIAATSREAALASLVEHLFTVEEVSAAQVDLLGQPVNLPAITEEPLHEWVGQGWKKLQEDFPGIAKISAMTDKRKKAIAARAGEIQRATTIEPCKRNPRIVWEKIFHEIRRSLYLTGRRPPGRNYIAPFKLTIDYVVRPSEFAKIFDGGYDDTSGNSAAPTHDEATGREFGPTERAGRAVLSRYRFAD